MESAQPIEQLNAILAGRYIIEHEIGRGGMATVYLARDLRHDRRVALKLLLPELGAILGPERFLGEIRVTANLQHPNLLPLFDSGEAEGRLYYVMPYVEGESLRHRLAREKQLPVDEAVRIAVACASGLDYAHKHHVIHRDLKPENILLSEGQPVIADFGIALAVSNAGGARITQSGLSLGTPQYMSPEQAAGDREVDGRSDIYALACVLYETLTGDPPHTGSTVQAIIAKVLVEKPRSVRSQRDTVPEHVDAAIQRALAKLPADRWPTAGQFGDALVQPALTAGVRAGASDTPGASAAYPIGRSVRARAISRWLWPAIALISVIVAGLGWWRAYSKEPPSPVEFTVSTGAVRVASELPRPIALSPDGRSVVYAGRAGGRRMLFARRLDNLETRAIPGTDDGSAPFFSPDGKWIGFKTPSNLLQKVPLAGGSAVAVEKLFRGFDGASWAPNGVIVIATDSGISRIAASGAKSVKGAALGAITHQDSSRNERYHDQPLILPDHKTFVFRVESRTSYENDHLAVGSLEEKGHTTLDLTGTNPIGFVDGKLFFGRADGSVAAVPFDVRRRKVTGDATVILDGVATVQGSVAASMSSNGSFAYVKASNTNQLVLADDRGVRTGGAEEARAYSHPRLSPEGRRIAVEIGPTGTGGSDIWIYDLASTVLSRVTSVGPSDRPEWTPDGKRIAYLSNRNGKFGAWWVAADGSGQEEFIYAFPKIDIREVTFSPDGRYAVFRVDDVSTRRDLWLLDLNADSSSRKAIPLLRTGFDELGARVSPDGRWMAYVSDESGRDEVYVRPFPGPGGRIQISSDGGAEPLWAGSPLRVIYRSGEKFIAATLANAQNTSVMKREVLFDDRYPGNLYHPNYDVDRTGKRFVLLQPFGDPEIVVLLNEMQQLLSRASGKEQ